MTAFAACIFALAALATGWTLTISWRQFGPAMRMVRAQRAACGKTVMVRWQSVDRLPEQPILAIRMRPARPVACAELAWSRALAA